MLEKNILGQLEQNYRKVQVVPGKNPRSTMKFLFGLMLAFLSCLALVSAASIESCQLPHKANGDGLRSCAAFFPSWSYNSQANQCEEFIYGGCGGNANRFSSQEECERACKK